MMWIPDGFILDSYWSHIGIYRFILVRVTMKIQSSLGKELSARFNKYMEDIGSKNQSQTAADLIDLALRIKEHSNDDGVSTKDMIQNVLEQVTLQTRTLNHIYSNTFPREPIDNGQLDIIRENLREFKIISDNDTRKFLEGN